MPAMGREAAPVTDVRFGSFVAIRDWALSTQNGRCAGHQSRTDDLSGIARYPEIPSPDGSRVKSRFTQTSMS